MADKKLKAIIETIYSGKGAKQAADDLNKVNKTAAQSKGILGALGISSKNATSSIAGLGKGLLGPTVGFLGLTGAITGTVNFLKSSLNNWADYNEEVSKLSTTTTAGTEDLSRMLQAADDLGIGMESLKTAFEYASKNGVVPTIDNIATLSDEMRSMTNIEARNQEMTRIFGRGWADASRFLLAGSDAIREGTAAISDSMVVTKESAQLSREYKLSLDALNDSWIALANTAGTKLMPKAVEIIDQINENVAATEKQIQVNALLDKLLGEGVITYDEYIKARRTYNKLFMDSGVMIENATKQEELYTARANNMAFAEALVTGAVEGKSQAVEDSTINQMAYTRALENSIPAMQYYLRQEEEAERAAAESAWETRKAALAVKFLFDNLNTDISGDIANTLDQIAYKLNFGDVVNKSFEDAKQAIQDGAITPEEGKKVLEGLSVAAEALKVKGGEIDFAEAAENIRANLDVPLKDAASWLQYLISKDGSKMNYTALLNILYSSSGRAYTPYNPGATGQGGGTGGGSGPRGATGLDMVVPAGYPGDTFPLWAQSGERVTITPSGKQAGGSSISIGDINIYESDTPQMTANAVVAAINSRMRQARSAGSHYATG